MSRNYLLGSFVLVLMCFLQMGVIMKSEGKQTVIAKTQTDPIGHEAKLEELKDGPKGAPTPSFEYYGHDGFLVEPPVEDQAEGAGSNRESTLPKPGDPIPEDVSEDEEDSEETGEDWWFEDWEEASEEPSKEDDFGV